MRFGIIGSAPNRQAVISWVNVPHSSQPPANYTFQAILDEETHRVRFQYQSVTPGRGPGDQGKSATVGLENAAGTVAARYSYNGSTLLVDNTAILFIPPAGAPAAGVLGVSPLEDFTSSGLAGGPFSPSSVTCTLVTTGGATLSDPRWRIERTGKK